MKVTIIGPGALGCLLASSLAIKLNQTDKKNPAPDLWLLDHRKDRAEKLSRQGLILEERGRLKRCAIKATADPKKIGTSDIIILCVKSPQVAEALKSSAQLVQEDTLLLTMQNGITHLELLKDKQKPPSIVIGVTAQGANLVSLGHVHHAGDGLTRVGFLKPASFSKSLQLAKLCNMLNYGGIETLIVDNIMDYVWSKLLVNAGINALTAIHHCQNGQLLESSDLKKTLTGAVREGEAVARALGAKFTDDPLETTLDVCRKTAPNISSMLQDVKNSRRTEIDAINGAITAAGRKLGIATPVNDELVAKVKEIEKNY